MSKQATSPAPAPGPPPALEPTAAPPAEPETLPARRRLPEELRAIRMTFLKDAFQVIAFSVAGVWALTSFWYQSVYLPRHEEPVVSQTLELQKLGERDDVVMVRARLKLHNSGKGTRYIGGFYFNAFGRKLVADADAGPAGVPVEATAWDAPLGYLWGARLVVATGGWTVLPPSRTLVGPGEDMVEDFVFPVRRDQVDLIEVHVSVLVTLKADRIQPDWVQRRTMPDGTLVMGSSSACRADPDHCALSDPSVTTTLSLWDDAGHPRTSGDAGVR